MRHARLPIACLLAAVLMACGASATPTAPAPTQAVGGTVGPTTAAPSATTQQAAATPGVASPMVPPTTSAAPATPATPATPRAAASPGTPAARKRYAAPPPLTIDPTKRYTARIKTDQGDIVVALNAQDAPLTVNNFVFLAREGFYDGVIFHRVIPGFVIQGGDPTGTGTGGPGYAFNDEPVKSKYEAGSIAMANAGRNTNGSQFFICDGPGCASLPPNYNHFGKVIEGLEVVTRIANVPKTRGSDGQQSKPITPVVIATIEITEE